ncbi:MAG: LysE family translocator [Hyphomicrobiales bacterium]|nr:LysE family translocator [Hyphomicrobiales bacterium]
MPIEFFIVSFVLTIIPGTGVLYAVSCGLAHGARGALWGAVSGALGVVPHIFAVGLGLSAILHTGSLLFEIIRYAGAAYLIYLAYKAWSSARIALTHNDTMPAKSSGIVIRGVLINLLNPKLTIFFFSFFPQFLTADATNPVAEITTMGTILIGQTFIVFLVYGTAAAHVRSHLQNNGAMLARCNRGLAIVFAALGARILAGATE